MFKHLPEELFVHIFSFLIPIGGHVDNLEDGDDLKKTNNTKNSDEYIKTIVVLQSLSLEISNKINNYCQDFWSHWMEAECGPNEEIQNLLGSLSNEQMRRAYILFWRMLKIVEARNLENHCVVNVLGRSNLSFVDTFGRALRRPVLEGNEGSVVKIITNNHQVTITSRFRSLTEQGSLDMLTLSCSFIMSIDQKYTKALQNMSEIIKRIQKLKKKERLACTIVFVIEEPENNSSTEECRNMIKEMIRTHKLQSAYIVEADIFNELDISKIFHLITKRFKYGEEDLGLLFQQIIKHDSKVLNRNSREQQCIIH